MQVVHPHVLCRDVLGQGVADLVEGALRRAPRAVDALVEVSLVLVNALALRLHLASERGLGVVARLSVAGPPPLTAFLTLISRQIYILK